jgi:hypothetical protein
MGTSTKERRMSRKAIVLGLALSTAGACAMPVTAKEPTPGVWGAWCDWLDSLGVPRASRTPEPQRPYASSWPEMPVDYSYDHLVDQP